MSNVDAEGNKKPADTAFKQQRLPAVRPIFTPAAVGAVFLLVGVPFIIMGMALKSASGAITELEVQYDGTGSSGSCQIYSSGAGTTCEVSFTAPEAMAAPVYVYYQLDNFYQNHRRYVKSYDKYQLLGNVESKYAHKECVPLIYNGTQTLHPCGLVANSLFNDKIILSTGQDISYDGIAWAADATKYKQPTGFESQEDTSGAAATCVGTATRAACSATVCSSAGLDSGCGAFFCEAASADYYGCDAEAYYFYSYPQDDSYQYLYETFPEVVSPLKGVETERFQVWMRVAALPKFRKLYAILNNDLAEGETVTFSVEANFDVSHFKGTKSLILTTTSWFGGKNTFIGVAFVAIGAICIGFGVLFMAKQAAAPRVLGDLKFLK